MMLKCGQAVQLLTKDLKDLNNRSGDLLWSTATITSAFRFLKFQHPSESLPIAMRYLPRVVP
jgi:hypothetical protein